MLFLRHLPIVVPESIMIKLARAVPIQIDESAKQHLRLFPLGAREITPIVGYSHSAAFGRNQIFLVENGVRGVTHRIAHPRISHDPLPAHPVDNSPFTQ
jgi:hypothetical protein